MEHALTTDLLDAIHREFAFTTARSSGPGGQNVNKVNSKVILSWDVASSPALNDEHRAWLTKKLGHRLTVNGVLMITSQEERSQSGNKETVIEKFDKLMRELHTPRKKRKATKPTKASKTKRLDSKKKHADKKHSRKKLY